MKTFHYFLRRIQNTRGTVIVYVGVAIVVLLGFVALAVDVGYVRVSRNEIQNVADGSALAATRRLGFVYESMTYQNQQIYNCQDSGDVLVIKQAALDVALSNVAAQQNIVLNDADIIIGRWHPEWTPPDIEPRFDRPDAVRVIARRPGAPTFFAKIFGWNTFDVAGIATAALTAESTAGPGGLPVPVGISRYWFVNNSCNQPIRFYPTNDPTSCAGWHVFDRYSNMNDRDLRTTIGNLEDGTYQSPWVTAGETEFRFGGGQCPPKLLRR